jgi:hypothetical protein
MMQVVQLLLVFSPKEDSCRQGKAWSQKGFGRLRQCFLKSLFPNTGVGARSIQKFEHSDIFY